MAINVVQPVATIQTASGQPAGTPAIGGEGVASIEAETSLAGVTEPVSGEAPIVTEPVKPIQVDIAPEALRQITGLSSANRKLKAELEALKVAHAAAVPAADVTEKLAQLASLENETPRAYLKRTGKTLEDIAADVLADDTTVTDPRMDAALTAIEELKKKLDEQGTKDVAETEAKQKQLLAAREADALVHVKNILSSQPDRWTLIQEDAGITSEVVKAAMIVVERDHTDKATGKRKAISQELATSIIYDCLDSAETYKLAEKMIADRKNTPASNQSLVKRKGLDVVDSASYKSSKGDDGKGVKGAQSPKVMIGSERGALRGNAVKRGPTDVRTARARAMRIAGATDTDLD